MYEHTIPSSIIKYCSLLKEAHEHFFIYEYDTVKPAPVLSDFPKVLSFLFQSTAFHIGL